MGCSLAVLRFLRYDLPDSSRRRLHLLHKLGVQVTVHRHECCDTEGNRSRIQGISVPASIQGRGIQERRGLPNVRNRVCSRSICAKKIEEEVKLSAPPKQRLGRTSISISNYRLFAQNVKRFMEYSLRQRTWKNPAFMAFLGRQAMDHPLRLHVIGDAALSAVPMARFQRPEIHVCGAECAPETDR